MAERDDRFWAGFLGIDAASWETPGVSVCAHAALGGYSGLWSFLHRERVVVSAPPAWREPLEGLVGGGDARQLLEPMWWRQTLGDAIERIIGPAYQGHLEPERFTPRLDPAAQLVDVAAAAPALSELQSAVGEEAWDKSALREVTSPLAVLRADGRVAAICGFRPRGENVGDPCVLVHPDFYGRGYGTAVVSAVVSSAIGDGKHVLYQTLESNLASVAIAQRLGYRQYARYLAIRLK